jgi:hypothetical protein
MEVSDTKEGHQLASMFSDNLFVLPDITSLQIVIQGGLQFDSPAVEACYHSVYHEYL